MPLPISLNSVNRLNSIDSSNQFVPLKITNGKLFFSDGQRLIYKGILLCNGHHWSERFPQFQGQFNGELIHSKAYKHPDQLRGKRVLVIGGGNSACDLAAEAARVGKTAVLSLRESVWFIPKTFAGVPIADLIQWWMPVWWQRLMAYGMIRLTFGHHGDYGLPQPQYPIFDKHPTLNNEVPYYIKHGRITPKPGVKRLDGEQVEFVDGSRAAFDLIVCATGFNVSYPFLPPELQRVQGPVVQCYGGAFLDDYKGLYYIGWGQARGGVGSLMSAYGPRFARLLKLQDQIKVPLGLVFKAMGQQLPTTHLADPQQIFRQLKLLDLGFAWLERKAYQVDAQHAEFRNHKL
jgi:hypothetical protein